MRIGIACSWVVKKYKSGTEHYATELTKSLFKLDKKNQYILYTPADVTTVLGKLPSNFSQKIIPFPRLWSQIRLSWQMLFEKLDVLFIPAHTIPVIHPRKTIVTLHDLGFKYFPELYTPFERFYHNFSMNYSVKHASKIITVSNYTKKDIIKNYGISSSKISVIYHGYNKELFNTKKTNIKKLQPYLYFIGRLENKKNLVRMVEAFSILRQDRTIEHKLVLAGRPRYGYEKFKAAKERLPSNIQRDIIELGYVETEEHGEYLKGADILFFPTLFEGFGMPVIEAMACGVPVVASNVTSLPEIVGNAGVLVNPYNVESIADGCRKLIKNPKLKQSYIKKGLERAKEFSWEKAGTETLNVLTNEN